MEEPARSIERELLVLASGGDLAAADWLLDEVCPIVFGFIYARVGGHEAMAEDLLQATLLEALRSPAGFHGEAALSTYLCSIARRKISKHFKAERRRELIHSRLKLVTAAEEESVSDEDIVADRDSLIRALGKLPALHRQVLVLKYLDGLSAAAIAEELGKSVVQVRSLLQRARGGLRTALEEHR